MWGKGKRIWSFLKSGNGRSVGTQEKKSSTVVSVVVPLSIFELTFFFFLETGITERIWLEIFFLFPSFSRQPSGGCVNFFKFIIHIYFLTLCFLDCVGDFLAFYELNLLCVLMSYPRGAMSLVYVCIWSYLLLSLSYILDLLSSWSSPGFCSFDGKLFWRKRIFSWQCDCFFSMQIRETW